MSKKVKLPASLTASHVQQIYVLYAMAEGAMNKGGNMKQLLVSEIASKSGLKDEKETQRYLYILEGHKLVTPCPPGDFTAKNWVITKQGVSTMKSIIQATDVN